MVIEIKDVPQSPNRGFSPKGVYNPLPEDFTFYWDSKPYVIPAGQTENFAEFIAQQGAKHLAEKIVAEQWRVIVNKEAVINVEVKYVAKPIPEGAIRDMKNALLSGPDAFREVQRNSKVFPEVTSVLEPKVEEPAVKEPEELGEFECDCGFVAKSKAGLKAHARKH